MVYYPTPLHKMEVFQEKCEIFGEQANAELACKSVLSLPIEPLQNQEVTALIIKTLSDVLNDSESAISQG